VTNLVAGGAGLLGSHLVDLLLDRGEEVVVIDNLLTGRMENLSHRADHPGLTFVRADLLEPLVPEITDRSFDRVYHLASPASPMHYAAYPIETLLVNSAGTRTLLDLARKNGARFVLASTSEVYGDPAVHPQVETYWGNVNPNGPRSCYDEGKRFGEAISMAHRRTHGTDVRIARIFNTYGPRSDPDDGRVVPALCVQALNGEPLTVFGDGSRTRSFCYVTDLVDGLARLMSVDEPRERVMNIGNPSEVTIGELARVVIDVTGSASTITHHQVPVDDPIRRCPDITIARRELGWEPTTPLREGLIRTLRYFRATQGPGNPAASRVELAS